MYEEAHYRLTAFEWNRDRQMWYVWCPKLLHPELCYTRTSNQCYVFNWDISLLTRALLRLERTMNLLEGGEGRMGERGWGGDGGRVGRGRGGEREGGKRGRVGERGRVGREGGWGGRGGEGRGGEVGEGRGRGGEGRGGMTVIHIVIGMFTSNPMIPQYLNNNLT